MPPEHPVVEESTFISLLPGTPWNPSTGPLCLGEPGQHSEKAAATSPGFCSLPTTLQGSLCYSQDKAELWGFLSGYFCCLMNPCAYVQGFKGHREVSFPLSGAPAGTISMAQAWDPPRPGSLRHLSIGINPVSLGRCTDQERVGGTVDVPRPQ